MGKVVESTIHRRARKAGYIVKKSRARNWSPDKQGEYMLIDADMNVPVLGSRFDDTLEEIVEFLAPEPVPGMAKDHGV